MKTFTNKQRVEELISLHPGLSVGKISQILNIPYSTTRLIIRRLNGLKDDTPRAIKLKRNVKIDLLILKKMDKIERDDGIGFNEQLNKILEKHFN